MYFGLPQKVRSPSSHCASVPEAAARSKGPFDGGASLSATTLPGDSFFEARVVGDVVAVRPTRFQKVRPEYARSPGRPTAIC